MDDEPFGEAELDGLDDVDGFGGLDALDGLDGLDGLDAFDGLEDGGAAGGQGGGIDGDAGAGAFQFGSAEALVDDGGAFLFDGGGDMEALPGAEELELGDLGSGYGGGGGDGGASGEASAERAPVAEAAAVVDAHESEDEADDAGLPAAADRKGSCRCLRSTLLCVFFCVPRRWPVTVDIVFDAVRDHWLTVGVVSFAIYAFWIVIRALPPELEWLQTPWGVMVAILLYLPLPMMLLFVNNPLISKWYSPVSYIVIASINVGVWERYESEDETYAKKGTWTFAYNRALMLAGIVVVNGLFFMMVYRKQPFTEYRQEEYEAMVRRKLVLMGLVGERAGGAGGDSSAAGVADADVTSSVRRRTASAKVAPAPEGAAAPDAGGKPAAPVAALRPEARARHTPEPQPNLGYACYCGEYAVDVDAAFRHLSHAHRCTPGDFLERGIASLLTGGKLDGKAAVAMVSADVGGSSSRGPSRAASPEPRAAAGDRTAVAVAPAGGGEADEEARALREYVRDAVHHAWKRTRSVMVHQVRYQLGIKDGEDARLNKVFFPSLVIITSMVTMTLLLYVYFSTLDSAQVWNTSLGRSATQLRAGGSLMQSYSGMAQDVLENPAYDPATLRAHAATMNETAAELRAYAAVVRTLPGQSAKADEMEAWADDIDAVVAPLQAGADLSATIAGDTEAVFGTSNATQVAADVAALGTLVADVGDFASESEQSFLPCVHFAVAVALLVAMMSTFYSTAAYRRLLLTVRRGGGPELSSWRPQSFHASKGALFLGVAFSGALFGFFLVSFIFFSVAFVVTSPEFYRVISQREVYEFLANLLAATLFRIFFLDRYLGRKVLSDGFQIRHPVAWTYYTVFSFLTGFITGVLSALLRFTFLIAISIGALFRYDMTIFPLRFAGFDSGYTSFMAVVASHHRHGNPVWMVAAKIFRRGDGVQRRPDGKPSRGAARFRWHLAHTLMRLPELRFQRRAFLRLGEPEQIEEAVLSVRRTGTLSAFGSVASALDRRGQHDGAPRERAFVPTDGGVEEGDEAAFGSWRSRSSKR